LLDGAISGVLLSFPEFLNLDLIVPVIYQKNYLEVFLQAKRRVEIIKYFSYTLV
jgi:hypothetical protein